MFQISFLECRKKICKSSLSKWAKPQIPRGMKTKTTIWQYGNYTFGSTSESAGTIFKEWVTKFVEGITVNLKLFFVPDDVVITEVKSQY